MTLERAVDVPFRLLAVKFQSHRYLVDAAFDFALEDEADEQFLHFVYLDVQLLNHRVNHNH